MTEEEIHLLRRARKLLPATEVVARAPGNEVVLAPKDDEHVVFAAHIAHGFGLPASAFFHRFLEFFDLQPHHLGANDILQLATFVAFGEGYIGIDLIVARLGGPSLAAVPTGECAASSAVVLVMALRALPLPLPDPIWSGAKGSSGGHFELRQRA